MGHNREKFGALLKSIIGNFKSIIGSGLPQSQCGGLLITRAIQSANQLYQIAILYARGLSTGSMEPFGINIVVGHFLIFNRVAS